MIPNALTLLLSLPGHFRIIQNTKDQPCL
jgi:hypothetical protein